MKSALEIVAFSNHTETEGTIALLQTTLKALDRGGDFMAAAYVDLALRGYLTRRAVTARQERAERNFDGLQDFG